jgi:hypothetical protein
MLSGDVLRTIVSTAQVTIRVREVCNRRRRLKRFYSLSQLPIGFIEATRCYDPAASAWTKVGKEQRALSIRSDQCSFACNEMLGLVIGLRPQYFTIVKPNQSELLGFG